MVIAVRLWISRHWLNAVVDGRRHIVRIDALAYGFTVDEVRVHANGSSGRRHVVWLATRPAENPL